MRRVLHERPRLHRGRERAPRPALHQGDRTMSLPPNNPSLAPDYLCAERDSWGGNGPYVVQPGATLNLPVDRPLIMPPVYGAGLIRVRTYLAFDCDGLGLVYAIGVSNPSENQHPMRPFTGQNYPNPVKARVGRNDCHRVDDIEPGVPVDPRSWTMNPGMTSGRST